MSSKIIARPALENPKPKKSRRKAHGRIYRDYIVEAMKHETSRGKSVYLFLFWNGHKFSPSRDRAKRYPRESDAAAEAKKLIRKAPRAVKFVRVVPA